MGRKAIAGASFGFPSLDLNRVAVALTLSRIKTIVIKSLAAAANEIVKGWREKPNAVGDTGEVVLEIVDGELAKILLPTNVVATWRTIPGQRRPFPFLSIDHPNLTRSHKH